MMNLKELVTIQSDEYNQQVGKVIVEDLKAILN